MANVELSYQEEQGLNNHLSNDWIEEELRNTSLKDERLRKRFRVLLSQLWNGIGQTIPLVCQNWANTKAAYRFLSNERIKEEQLLAGHFQITKRRVEAHQGEWILVIQDTTEFSFQRENKEAIGITRIVPTGVDLFGKPVQYKKCGVLMHSSLAISDTGLPLGLTAIKFWTREQFKGTNALKRHINPTRIPIEQKESYRWLENLKQSTALLQAPKRCVHIGDRESDIYELFCIAQELGTHFLVRTCVNRLIEDGSSTIADKMNTVEFKGLHRIELQDADGNKTEVPLAIKYQHINVLPPTGKQKKYPGLSLTIIHAEEEQAPIDRDKIAWKLITNLPITSLDQAIEKLDWYALRWRIEIYQSYCLRKSQMKINEPSLLENDKSIAWVEPLKIAV